MKNVIFLPLLIVLASCAPLNGATPTPVFLGVREFSLSVDESVACQAFPPKTDDISMNVVDDSTLTLTANAQRKPGLFVDAIAAKNVTFQDDSVYTLTGEFRKVEGGQPEQIDANLQFIENFTEYRAEIIWYLNPFRKDYGDIAIRLQGEQPITVYHLGDDIAWHKFSVTVEYRSDPKSRIYKSAGIDGKIFSVDRPAGTLPKTYEGNFAILLETHNMNTNCNPLLNFTASSQWRNIVLERNNP